MERGREREIKEGGRKGGREREGKKESERERGEERAGTKEKEKEIGRSVNKRKKKTRGDGRVAINSDFIRVVGFLTLA